MALLRCVVRWGVGLLRAMSPGIFEGRTQVDEARAVIFCDAPGASEVTLMLLVLLVLLGAQGARGSC